MHRFRHQLAWLGFQVLLALSLTGSISAQNVDWVVVGAGAPGDQDDLVPWLDQTVVLLERAGETVLAGQELTESISRDHSASISRG